jgi:hypothetical protein
LANLPQVQSYSFNSHCSFDPPEDLLGKCQALLLSRVASSATPWFGVPTDSGDAAIKRAFAQQHTKAWLPFDRSLLRYSPIDM